MRRFTHGYRLKAALLCILLLSCVCSGCAQGSDPPAPDADPSDRTLRDATPSVLEPSAPGVIVSGTDEILLDTSNTSEGYLALIYSGTNEKVKFRMEMPDGVTYTYLVTGYGEPLIYPLSGGSGAYQVSVLESVDIEEDLYAVTFSEEVDVSLSSEFAPFLTPNCYVDYQEDSKCVDQGASLCRECVSDLDAVSCIYDYVIHHISYDDAKAQNVAYGYTPNPDETLESGKGICFDYASLMTAMLRSQRIPTKLEVGYSGDVYHAWISCFIDEIGWVDGIIQFDGKSWTLMDPTLASNNKSSDVKKFIGDGSKYVVKYTY